MRTAFIETLCSLAESNKDIWLLTGDLGFSVLEPFARQFPERYVNVGVAEQNMTGIAAGLVLSGKIAITYSIANFPLMRCLEQIRNDVCYHKLNVKLVAVGGGLAYGTAGYSHHALEDLAVMRAMPNMTILAPGDPVETRLATRAMLDVPGPCYLRLGKAREPIVHKVEPRFSIGKSILLRTGTDLTFFSTGGILENVVKAADVLEQKGYSIGVVSLPILTPLDTEVILDCINSFGRIVTVEEHGQGGLGTIVAEVISQSGRAARFRSIRVGTENLHLVGSQDALRSINGLSVDGLVKAAMEFLS